MKKLLIAGLCCTVLSAHAATCPPSSAFTHAGPYQDWLLDSAYQSEWRISYNPVMNQVNEKELSSRAILDIRLFPSHANNNFFEECRYKMGDIIIWVYSNNDYHINPEKFTNFYAKVYGSDTNYLCTTLAGNPSKCVWK